MRAKKIGYFLSVLLLFSAFMCTVDALSITTVTFYGVGVTIDLTYPEEAHPAESIWHNVTITANTALTLRNFTVVIKAPVNSGWQVVFADKLPTNFPLQANTPFEWPIQTDTVPQEANGKLSCFMNVSTSQSTDYSSYTFYTTHVSEPTFSEMQILYDEMLANYTELQANYTTLLNEYDGLLANYSSLFANYTTLLSEHTQLLSDYDSSVAAYESLVNAYNMRLDEYNALNSKYEALDSNYRSKINDYSALQKNYSDLNSTHNSLQANCSSLQADYDELNQTYNDLRASSESALNTDRILMFIFVITLVALIAFIIYLKRGKEEPYVVIRKETVSMNQDENP